MLFGDCQDSLGHLGKITVLQHQAAKWIASL